MPRKREGVSHPPDQLAEYRRKRDFQRTSEPSGGPTGATRASTLRFVVQKHAASHLHFDLRLELDGVMKSWAVPKGPSLDPTVKRLAMQVEDHPIDYNTFEGTIPAGEYGGGTVMLWDRGTYSADEPGTVGEVAALRAGLAAGKIAFTLHGTRLHGSFALVRTHPRAGASASKPQWLLIKHRDPFASADSDPATEVTTSVATGRTMAQIAAGAPPTAAPAATPPRTATRRAISARAAPVSKRATGVRPVARAATRSLAIAPMLASVADSQPAGAGWTFEPKYDGVRLLIYATRTGAALMTRNGHDKAAQFPSIAAAAQALATWHRASLVLDGEIVAVVDGAPGRFQALQNRIHVRDATAIDAQDRDAPVAFVAFDLLVDGETVLTAEPWSTRRHRLEQVLGKRTPTRGATDGAEIRLAETSPDGAAMLRRARAGGWEGVMAKRTDAPYLPGVRSPAWRKLKLEARQEFVVGGYTDPRNSRIGLGALLVGYYDGRRLIYAGHVGGGFTTDGLRAMRKRLTPLARATAPFATTPETNEPAHWVRPSVVVEVKFNEWTDDGRLRQPIFLGVRDDKDPRTVVREPVSGTVAKRTATVVKPAVTLAKPPAKTVAKAKAKPTVRTAPTRARAVPGAPDNPVAQALAEIESDGGNGTVTIGPAALAVTHLDKVFFPAQRYTKGDVMRYYARVAASIVPTTTDRPLVLKRYPDGIGGPSFYQQNAGTAPRGVRVETIDAGTTPARRFVGGTLATLLHTIQLGCISIDPWHSRVTALQSPDYLVIDLDPGDRAPFARVVAVARAVHETLTALGLHGAPKTSGATGLHIYVPLPLRTPADAATMLAQLIATRVATAHPRDATIVRAVKARDATAVYVDYLQNIVGKTIAGAYAVRAVPGAQVSTPLEWSEVTDGLDPAAFTIETVPARLARIGDIWGPALRQRNTAAALRALR
jgi:bifunctional non-homologous end joining protein LigD